MQIKLKPSFWTPDITLTKNCNIMFLIGPRGVGKTYGVKKWCVKRFLKKGEQFVYMRRYDSELDLTITTLFNDFKDDEFLKDYDFKIGSLYGYKQAFFIKHKTEKEYRVMGFYMSLSTSFHFKATSYPNVANLIYDEFLFEKGDRAKELKQEFNKFFNVLETIFRLRNFRCFMLGNATTFDTCYKDGFNLQKPFNTRYWRHKTKPIIVEMIDKKDYTLIKKQSLVGVLAQGTEYESYAIDNNFIFDSKSFVKKKRGNYKFIMGFYYKNKSYGLFTNNHNLIVDTTKLKCSFQIKDESLNYEKIKVMQRNHPVVKYLSKWHNMGLLYYQNENVKSDLFVLFNKIL